MEPSLSLKGRRGRGGEGPKALASFQVSDPQDGTVEMEPCGQDCLIFCGPIFPHNDVQSRDPQTAIRVNGTMVHVPGELGHREACAQHALWQLGEPVLEAKEALQ